MMAATVLSMHMYLEVHLKRFERLRGLNMKNSQRTDSEASASTV